ncbi:EpsI family protein [Sulfuricella denitrificans skB26]|uniref:EpsI family protein n=1 Tax=Sulfuricella denitrificans (strain DSM 22764 / NBRC 105220 / skB26) TaxID=1163617 RepID=S6AA36_SULDS|nr:VPLPA-CTERM-specific exosortase XrtD [Sulfuricella denitrificans]BAN35175.1 EpsI family protein [Sulfuricella denitrificans skB26]
MMNDSGNAVVVWRPTLWIWLVGAVLCLLTGVIYFEGLKALVAMWDTKEEYSYGYMIPFITLFLIWQRKDLLERIDFNGSWAGFVLVLVGLALFLLGNLSTLFLIVHYSFLVVVLGLVLAFCGWQGFKIVAVPLLFLAFMIPLPSFLLTELSTRLQFISSEIGVWVIRLFGISVFLEGNVIDLGSLKLQVVEACSGLRYLFPLMTLGFISAYFFKAAFWKRAFVFLSSIPVTVLMNSFRIGIIGVTVEYWGKEMAEGFLHDFEGWAVFMACTAVLVVEMWVLSKIGNKRLPLREAFGLELPAHTPEGAQVRSRELTKPFLSALFVVMAVSIVTMLMPERVEVPPQRKDFSTFPLELGSWKGKDNRLEQIYLDALKLDDYLLVDFSEEPGKPVNLYMAYYATQRKGESAHSPRTCIPGGGWTMVGLAEHVVEGVTMNGRPLVVNRAVIQLGEQKQLTYYWFQQRGRVITNEYLVKWFIFWDALTRNRTDGALVRLVAPVMPGEDVAVAEQRLQRFLKEAAGQLSSFVPD